MIDPETSFTVEVLGFQEGADAEAVAERVSGFFGISLEEGRRLVRKAPIRVKRGATPEVAQQLVRQLRKLGAKVLVRNEQTGEDRTYEPNDGRRPTHDSLFTPPEDTLESEDGDAPPETPPSVEVIPPPALLPEGLAAPANADVEADAPPPSPRDEAVMSAPRESSDSLRGSQPVSTPRPAGLLSLPPPSSSASLPPPAAPILGMPPSSAAKLDFCASCKGPVDRGETCSRCGWNNVEKERHCRQCKRKLSVVSAVSGRPLVQAIAVLGAIAVGAGILVLLGPAAGAAGVALGACLTFVADGATLRYACKSCTIAVITGRLQKEEEARLGAAKRKALAVAATCGVVTAGLLALGGLSRRSLADASYGVSWSLPLPRMHGRIGTELTTIRIPTGSKRVRVSFAERPYLGGPVYFLTHVQYTHPAAPVTPDPAGLEISVKQLVEVYFEGSLTGGLEQSGDSVMASFTGKFHGKQIFGRLRGAQNDHDMMVVVVASESKADVEDAAARDMLNGVVVQRDPM